MKEALEIQLTNTNESTYLPHKKIELKEQKRIRYHHHLCWFTLTLLAEILTIVMGFLKIVLANQIFYPISFFTALIRIAIFFKNSVLLTKGINIQLVKYYCALNQSMALVLCSSAAYITLNVYQTHQTSIFSIPAIVIYPFLLFFLNGNFNVMIFNADWNKSQIFLYKIIKYAALLTYLSSGIISIISVSNELLLLWIFITLQFYSGLLGKMSEIDGTNNGYDELYVFQE